MHPRRARPDRSLPAPQDAASRRLALIAAGTAPVEEPAAPGSEDAWWADHTHIAAALPLVGAEEPDPPALPVPGRHAARRRVLPSTGRLRDLLPSLAPAHVAVVAVVVALGLAVTAWWVVRADPGPGVVPVAGEVSTPLVTTAEAGPAALTSGATTATPLPPTSGASVTVDVAGKVRRPGIVVLAPGSRVADALRTAGGARPGVATTGLNLARVLVDGEQIVVGAPAPPAAPAGGPGPSGASAAPASGGPLVNLNTAGQAEPGDAAAGRPGDRAGDHRLSRAARRVHQRRGACWRSMASGRRRWPASRRT
ncbi:hypothetical protein G5V59_26315 [Nocardioides sp. W3-2-3]|nr:hypothetical protein [Nocardioides convexus]